MASTASDKEFNVSKIKHIESYVGTRKFSLELQKKKQCIAHSSRKELDDLPSMHAVSYSELDDM